MSVRKTLDNKAVKLILLIGGILFFFFMVGMQGLITAEYVVKGHSVAAILIGVIPAIFYGGLAVLALWIILRDFWLNKKGKRYGEKAKIKTD